MADREIISMLAAIASGRDVGKFQKCPICGEYSWTNAHTCAPIFLIREVDDDLEDARKVYAETAQQAAENYLNQHFGDFEYPKEHRFLVRDQSQEHEWIIDVFVEAVPSFSSEIIKQAEVEPAQKDEETDD